MIIFRSTIQHESAIQKLKRKEWERSMQNITDGEIISFDPDPLKTKNNDSNNLPVKVEEKDNVGQQTTNKV